ncbi:MAG: adenosylcobinamide-phosphate synthase CbiB [Synergistaceae bacterium]
MLEILTALLLDAIIGDPRYPYHPAILIGKLISFLEKVIYDKQNARERGTILAFFVIIIVGLSVSLLLALASILGKYVLFAANVFLLYSALAFRCLIDESSSVAQALAEKDIIKARNSLSNIVGRETDRLCDKQIIKASIETVAENSIDGCVAPFFYMLIGAFFGQPALFAWIFKSINTMDSMIGYKNERYEHFGTTGAKLDDIANFIPARIGSWLAIIAGGLCGFNLRNGIDIFLRDRKKHLSPNSAHAESAYCGLLGIELGGGAYRNGIFVEASTIGNPLKEQDIWDIARAHKILNVTASLCGLITLFLWYVS